IGKVPLAVITNGPSDLQRFKIEVLGIESWFDAIVVSGEVGQAKQTPLSLSSPCPS
ncbi:MAG: HAD hydrolase-like protein, partial [Gemmatimonadetes bacterium]|nr:HAD hydrolase-like protein [Gemmatimonadota bacterium]